MVYRTMDTETETQYKLKWWKRRKARVAATSGMATTLITLLVCALVFGGCKNKAISYAKELDPRVKCSSVNTSWWSTDTAVCRLALGSGKTEMWACTSMSETDGFAGYPRCVVTAIYDAERK